MKKLIITIIVIAAVGVAYYGLSPLFNTIEVDDALPENTLSEEEAIEEANREEVEPMDEEMPETAQNTEQTYAVMGTTGHPASGHVRIVQTSTGPVIRYENFETINGPNLHLYLAKDLEANEYLDLGPIKGTQGNINYEVPEGVDLSEYRYVMYWCVPFSVLFNYAEIN
jgi:hypothetical protein